MAYFGDPQQDMLRLARASELIEGFGSWCSRKCGDSYSLYEVLLQSGPVIHNNEIWEAGNGVIITRPCEQPLT